MSASFLAKGLDYSSSSGDEANIRELLGAALMADWRQAMIARGLGFHVDIGAFSTPIQGGGAGTILDQDQPEGIISVASGQTIVPIRVLVACATPLIAADADETEILLAVDRVAAYDLSGTVTAETAINMRTSATGNPTGVTCHSAGTANITNPTLGLELAHEVLTADLQGIATNALWGRLNLLYEPQCPPFLVGPCAMYLYFGGTVATSGFAQIEFLSFATSLISGLS